MKIVVWLLFCLLVANLVSSCATPKLWGWKEFDPDRLVEIPQKDISEAELKAGGIKYYRDDRAKVYYVEKNSLCKLRDYVIRVVGTPITAAIDVSVVAVVVAAVAETYYILNASGFDIEQGRARAEQEKSYQDRQERKWRKKQIKQISPPLSCF